MQVYLAVLILKPTQKEVFEEGAVPMLIGGGPHIFLADNDTQAAGKAMTFLPEEMKGKVDRVDVAIMPFRRATTG